MDQCVNLSDLWINPTTQMERIIYSKEGWFVINYSTKNVKKKKKKKEYKLNSKCYRWHVAENILTVRSWTTHALMKLLLCHLKRTHQAAPAYLSNYYILWDSEIDWTHYTYQYINNIRQHKKKVTLCVCSVQKRTWVTMKPILAVCNKQ